MTSQQDWTTRLFALLDEQQTIVDALAELTDRQHTLIEQRSTDALLSLLAERQRLIDQFTTAQRSFNDLTDDFDRRLQSVDVPSRELIRQRIDAIGARLSDVMARDAQDQKRLHDSAGKVKDELGVLKDSQRARRAYLGTASNQARFADRQG